MPEPVTGSGIIVAGMHRSSTSLVASAFAACGYELGDDMLPAAPDNPKGYFEDREVHLLHRRMLESYRTAWDLSARLRELRREELEIAPHLYDKLRAVVDDYRARQRWVWKNPRATLFLEAWSREFPEAVFVICVRPPAEVADSMLRRKDRMRISDKRSFYRTRRLFRALSIWRSYNLMALRFAKNHPDRTLIVRIPRDLPTMTAIAGGVFEPSLLRKARRPVRLQAAFALRTRWLYWRLARRARPAQLEALLRDGMRARQREPQRDAGQVAVAALLRVAASAAVSAALDVGYNVTF